MKKIVAAWIEQILEFPSKLEYLAYMEGVKAKGQKFSEVDYKQLESGVVRIQVRKQYNNNAFPDDMKEGESMIIKDEQIEILKPYIENIDKLVQGGSVQEILDAIDDVIVDNILGNDDEPDEEGIKLQKVYDEIYDQN